jgi:colicin import membrane protein
MKLATAGGPYKVPRQHNSMRAVVLAVAMHAVLLLFLWVGVSWQNNEPVEVQAEIWDMKVQEAAPTPPTPQPEPAPEPEPEPAPVVKAPPPPPVEAPVEKQPDIVTERLKLKKKLEEEKKLEEVKLAKLKKEADEKQAKIDAKKLADKKAAEQKLQDEKEAAEKEKALAEKDKKKAAAEKLAKEKADKAAKDKAFAAEMSRITGSAAKGTSGTAAQSTGDKVDGGYAAAIKAKIKSNLIYGSEDDSLTASYVITQLPTGEIIGTRKVKGSGSTAYDSAIENAIAKSSPLPKKKDGTVEREITLDFKLKDMH